MGTPKSVYRDREPVNVSVAETLQAFASAQYIARTRTEESREAALERLRRRLEPMVPWLFKQVSDLLNVQMEKKSSSGKTRMLVLFDLPRRSSVFSAWLGVSRDGDWLMAEYDHNARKWGFTKMDGETLDRMIWTWRDKFLGPHTHGVEKLYDRIMENRAIAIFMRHACLLGFFRKVFEGVNGLLETREERLQTLRENLKSIESFGDALDPLHYHDDLTLPEYSVFYVRPGHTSRCSANYLVKDLVEQQIAKLNAGLGVGIEDGHYKVDISECGVSNSQAVIRRVSQILADSLKDYTDGGSARTAFSDEEIWALEAFVRDACNLA